MTEIGFVAMIRSHVTMTCLVALTGSLQPSLTTTVTVYVPTTSGTMDATTPCVFVMPAFEALGLVSVQL